MTENKQLTWILIIAFVVLVATLQGCGAVHGVGSDLIGGSKAGAEWFRVYGENHQKEYYPAPRIVE